jgi:cell division protein ZipA
METALRLILLLLGVVIVVGIVWDFRRNKSSKKSFDLNTATPPEPLFDDVRLIVKSEKQEPTFQGEAMDMREEIMAFNIMARQPNIFTGKKLKNAFADTYLYYGEMELFHRFEHIDGSGEKLFSVVSSVEPGFFNLSEIDTLRTPGITLFFITTTPNHSMYTLELMLRTAKQLALRLEGDLKDDKHRFLTREIIENYRDRIRDRDDSKVLRRVANK